MVPSAQLSQTPVPRQQQELENQSMLQGVTRQQGGWEGKNGCWKAAGFRGGGVRWGGVSL